MDRRRNIEHEGIIQKIKEDQIYILINSSSACSTCGANKLCSTSESNDKTVEVKCNNKDYKIGDNVIIELKQSQGFKAVFIAYIIPVILLLTTIIVMKNLTKNEGLSALIALIIMVPYFLGVYIFRKYLKESFSFKIKKQLNFSKND